MRLRGNVSLPVSLWVIISFLFLVSAAPLFSGAAPHSRPGEEERTLTKEESGGVFEQQRDTAKTEVSKRKFPWLLVLFGGAVAAVAVYFFVIKKAAKFTLTVTVGEGVSGTPFAGMYQYKKGESVDYNYWPASGYKFVVVKLDGQPVGVKSSIVMNSDHTLEVQATQVPPDLKRVVVVEKYTAIWCGFCPGAAMGIEELKNEVKERLVVISYHNDSFTNQSVWNARNSFYGVNGIPDVYFDGVERQLGGSPTESQYSFYKPLFDLRAAIAPQVYIQLAAAGSNAVNVTVTNLTSSNLTSKLQVAIIENEINFAWMNQTRLQYVCRDMLPSASGERITLAPGQSVTKSRTYTLDPGWNRANCRIVAFVQGDNKEIYQGAEIGL